MRIIAIDASPINGGPASYAVDVTATTAEESAADVVRIRLYDLHAYCCIECGACTTTGRCTRRDGLLSHAEGVMAQADALVLAAPTRMSTSSVGATALLRRLLGAFTGTSVARGWYNVGGTFAQGKRAAVIASGPAPFALLRIGPLGMAGVASKQLASAHVTLIDCPAIPTRFSDPAARDRTRERAEALGRELAQAKEGTGNGGGPRKSGRRSRVSPLMTPDSAAQ